MTTFLALYRGATISSAELVAVSADNHIVQDFATRLITDEPNEDSRPDLHLVELHQSSNENEMGVRAHQDMDSQSLRR
jgi:hypothetical protein